MKRCLALWILLFSIGGGISAQPDKPLRVEVNVSVDQEPFGVLSLGESGVLLHTAVGESLKGSGLSSQLFVFYDSYLLMKWQVKTFFPYEYALMGSRLEGDSLLLVLRSTSYRNYATPTYLLRMGLQDGGYSVDTLGVKTKLPSIVASLSADKLWTLHTERSQCVLSQKGLSDTSFVDYEFSKFSNSELLDAMLDTATGSYYVLTAHDSRRDDYLSLWSFDRRGELAFTTELRLAEGQRPVQAKFFQRKGLPFLILGTYNLSSERQSFDRSDRITTSTGFFSASLQDQQLRVLSTLHYAQIDSIESLLSLDQLALLRRQKERRQSFSMDITLQFRGEESEGRYALIGESFERQYKSNTETYYDYYGRVVPYTTSVFEGYSFQDAFVVRLDSMGYFRSHTVADITLSPLSGVLRPQLAYLAQDRSDFVAYINANTLYYKELTPSQRNFQALKLSSLHRADRLMQTSSNRLMSWYGVHVLVMGYQTVQNNVYNGPSKRSIFYMSKLTLD